MGLWEKDGDDDIALLWRPLGIVRPRRLLMRCSGSAASATLMLRYNKVNPNATDVESRYAHQILSETFGTSNAINVVWEYPYEVGVDSNGLGYEWEFAWTNPNTDTTFWALSLWY